MPTKRPEIIGLEWDEENEEHIDAWLIEELIAGDDWFACRNDRGHPPEHRLFVGRTPAGVFVTAVLREPSVARSGIWRPITGWTRPTRSEPATGPNGSVWDYAMTDQATKATAESFTPVTSDADCAAQGWAEESEPVAAASRLAATISIRLDPDSAALVRRAARRLNLTKSEFVRRATIRAAVEVIEQSDREDGRSAST